jgi:threonine 3-dehydrogenase
LGNATHTALQWPLVGEDVLITGAGPIGVIAAAIARHAGAKNIVVTDVSDYRLALAKGAGADLTVNVASTRIKDAQRSLGMREGFDVGLEMSGAPSAVAEMLANLNHGGKVAMLGLPKDPYPIDWGRVITHMITLKGIYGREMFETWYLMSSMLASSEVFKAAVSSVITHRFPADQWADGFAAARSGDCGKVVLDWS